MSQESVLIKRLEKELKRYNKVFKEVADTTMDKGVSNYPVFVAHQQGIALGIPLIDSEQSNTSWSYNITTLEELVTKNIVHTDKLKNFKEVYKDPVSFICLFVVEQKGATFIFYPYHSDLK